MFQDLRKMPSANWLHLHMTLHASRFEERAVSNSTHASINVTSAALLRDLAAAKPPGPAPTISTFVLPDPELLGAATSPFAILHQATPVVWNSS